MKLKDFNIIYGALLVSLLIAEMSLEILLNIPVIRYLQIFILINIFGFGFKLLRKTLIFLIPVFIYSIHGIFNFQNIIVLGEFFNIVWWFIFMTIINHSINDHNDFERFKKILFRSTFFLITIASTFGLYKLYSTDFIQIFNIDILKVSIGTSLNEDYNIYSIALYCGLISGIYCYSNVNGLKSKLVYAVAILIILISSMLSGSRRGLIIGILIAIYIIVWPNINYYRSGILKTPPKNKSKSVKIPWISVILFVTLLFVFFKLNLKTFIESRDNVGFVIDRLMTISDISSTEEDSRSNRWEFSFDTYLEFSITNKVFGNGFTYLQLFGNKFGVFGNDYPHNVWISALLYGGLIGFITTVGLTVYVFYFLFKKRKVFNIILVWYILFLILNFTSSNSIYSSRVFVVLLLFPFLSFCNEKKLIDEE